MPRPLDLPEYIAPPVIEVVLGVQFAAIPLQAVHFGLFWDQVRAKFPKTEDKAPLDPAFEKFESGGRPPFKLRFEALETLPLPRVWFMNVEGTELLQVQSTRFIRNWRKIGEGDLYPRYEQVRDGFLTELGVFRDFVRSQGLGDLKINQCEVTYVNHIRAGSGWTRHGEAARIFKPLADLQVGNFLPQPEEYGVVVRYLIEDGGIRGRLHVEFEPGIDTPSQTPMYALKLTSRGAPLGEDIESAATLLDTGRQWIVRGFTELTTDAMHQIWRRNA